MEYFLLLIILVMCMITYIRYPTKVSQSIGGQSAFGFVTYGQPNTSGFRIYLVDTRTHAIISPFHQIDLYRTCNGTNSLYNFIVEIPMGTYAKMEIQKNEYLNPIAQDSISNHLRFIEKPYIWNYGAFPQTFESPAIIDKILGQKGDNDPLDVFEISQRTYASGSIVAVKVLGALGLIDRNETDWKILTLDAGHPFASHIDDIDDVEDYFPGLLLHTRQWFITRKKPGEIRLGFNGSFLNRHQATEIIAEKHEHWQNLGSGIFYKP